MTAPEVFLSYAREDTEAVRRVHAALVERGSGVWVDWEDIPPSAAWFAEIQAGIRAADGFVYVISPDSVASDVCGKELAYAASLNKRIVPVVVRPPGDTEVPAQAAELNWVFVDGAGDGDFDDGIAKLVLALETDLDHVRAHTRLGVEAERWQESGQDRSRLLRGSELAEAERWLVADAGKQPEPTQVQRAFVLAGRQGATRRQSALVAGVSVALVVAVVLSILALVQRSHAIHQSDVAYSRQLDAEAQGALDTDPELSVLLAARAARTVANAGTERTLRQSLAASQVRDRYRLNSPGGDVVYSPDGTRLLVTSTGRTKNFARIYAPGADTEPVELPGPEVRGASGFDGNGDRVVIGGSSPAVYDANSGALVRALSHTALYAALSSDGSTAVTVDVGSTGHVFDVDTGRETATFTPRLTGLTTCFAVSRDGRYAAQCDGNADETQKSAIDVWDTTTGELVRTVETVTAAGGVAFGPSGGRFVYTVPGTVTDAEAAGASLADQATNLGLPGTFVYRTTGTGGPVITFPGAASSAAWSPDPTFKAIAFTTITNVAYVYSFASRRLVPLTGATATPDVVRFDRSGGYVLVGGQDRSVRVYEATRGGLPIETLSGHRGQIVDASFGAGARSIATSATDGTSRVWQGPTTAPSAVAADAPNGDTRLPDPVLTPDGTRVVLPGNGSTLSPDGRILDARSLNRVASFSAPSGRVLVGVAMSDTGKRFVAVSGTVDLGGQLTGADTVTTYDVGTGKQIRTMTPAPSIVGVQPDASATRVVVLETDGLASLWNTLTGEKVRTLRGTTTPAAAAAFSKDGSRIAIAHYPDLPETVSTSTSYGPVVVDVFDADSGKKLRSLTGPDLTNQVLGQASAAPLTLAFSPDGRTLAFSGADPTISLVDPETGKPRHAPLTLTGRSAGQYVASLAFSPDGKQLAAGSSSGAYLWRTPSYAGEPVVLEHVPPGDTSLVIGGGYGVRVGFTRDSRTLSTVGANRLAAWNLADRLRLLEIYPIGTGALAPNGSRAIGANGDGISTYDCDLCGNLKALLALAKERTTRGFTADEKAAYLDR